MTHKFIQRCFNQSEVYGAHLVSTVRIANSAIVSYNEIKNNYRFVASVDLWKRKEKKFPLRLPLKINLSTCDKMPTALTSAGLRLDRRLPGMRRKRCRLP
jgi:hypothetical protein